MCALTHSDDLVSTKLVEGAARSSSNPGDTPQGRPNQRDSTSVIHELPYVTLLAASDIDMLVPVQESGAGSHVDKGNLITGSGQIEQAQPRSATVAE
jgi:hypothetical protein